VNRRTPFKIGASACYARLLCLAFLLLGVAKTFSAESSSALAAIETPFFRFSLSPNDGHCEIYDKRAKVMWQANGASTRFGQLRFSSREQAHGCDLTRCDVSVRGTEVQAVFRPFSANPWTTLLVRARALPDQKTLELSYQEDNDLEVEGLTVLEDVLGIPAGTKGYAVVPVREGLLIPADGGLTFTHSFDTYSYEGCHMAMFGLVKEGAAALVYWDDPYVRLELKKSHERLSPAVGLTGPARSFRVQFLGPGDYVTIGKAYREVAREKGWLVTWNEKLKRNPERAKLFGAANFKLWSALDRRMNEESTQEQRVRVNWTFDEAAQVAEHLKNDLKLDKVLFTVGGWIRRGYDNQHPDILPTAPECGGDAAFRDCARRVLNLGYLVCLHDNYQDIYRDSPSWDERFIMKTEHHQLARGGRWAGGRAYLTCSQMALDLAKRPRNLSAVKQLSGANAYFIDTTYAAGLQECYDPAHWLTRSDDMKWKQALSDYARELFGVFGSECGREWAIPHADFFEGLTGVSGRAYHDANLPKRLGATTVPLFDLVYRDCIAMYGKYGYDPQQAAEYVLRHISLGRPLNYHEIPPHLYWKQPPAKEESAPSGSADPALFTRAEHGWAYGLYPLDRFVKNTYEVLSPLNELTAQRQMTQHSFLTADYKVQRTIFGEGTDAVEVVVNLSTNSWPCSSQLGGKVLLPPYGFLVESPAFVAFCALDWGGRHYDSPALFTLHSVDENAIARSRRVRIYHGFGSPELKLGGRTITAETELVLDLSR
jgi:hypothetical protein